MAKRCPTCDRRYGDEARFCLSDGATLEVAVDTDPLVGAVFEGRYRIEGVLGAGGMGVVYAGRQLAIDRRVAIKVLRAESARNDKASARFMREARLMSQLESPHTVTVFDYGETEQGQRFIVMEYLEGRTLGQLLAEDGPASVAEAVRILDGVAESLAEAHAKEIVHRDLKPSNVFLARTHSRPAFVKVLDFGIARPNHTAETTLTETGQLIGTPAYMSPELLAGERVGPRSDVYAMGLMLYELLAGRHPFAGKTKIEMYTAHIAEAPPALDQAGAGRAFPPEVSAFVMRCLAKQPALRPRNADAFRRGLADITTDRPTPAPAASPGPQVTRAAIQAVSPPATPALHVGLAIAAAVMVVLAGAAAAWFLTQDAPTPSTADATEPAAPGPRSAAESARPEADAEAAAGEPDADGSDSDPGETAAEVQASDAPLPLDASGGAAPPAATATTPSTSPTETPPKARRARKRRPPEGAPKVHERPATAPAKAAEEAPRKGGLSAEDKRKIDLFRE